MNLRKITLRYMGWCPGVEAASKFIPDRDIPPSRVALLVVLAAFVSVSSFIATQRVLNAVVYPSASTVSVNNDSPVLAVSEDVIYIAMNVETTMKGSAGTLPKYHGSSVYVAKLCLDGTLEDEVEVIDLGDAYNLAMDLLVSGDGRWLLAYEYDYGKRFVPSSLYVVSSGDGRLWEEPTVVAQRVGEYYIDMTETERQRVRVPDKPSLMEAGKGEVFISFGVTDNMICYSVLTPENGWSSPAEIPIIADEQSCFLDKDGRISVVGADIDWDFGFDQSPVKAVSYTVMEKDGSWTESRILTHQSFPIYGQWPRMLYSERHGGYLLTMRNPWHPQEKALTVYFTPDLELGSWSWNWPATFMDAWEGYLAELSDGTLVLVFSSNVLYLSTSGDGENWTTPIKVEQISDEEALIKALSTERTYQAGFISLAVTAIVMILAFKIHRIGLGKLNAKKGLQEATM